MDIKAKVSGRISKPVHEVFEAVADPAKLSGYFTTGGASGRIVPGATVTWDFADFPGAFPVRVVEVVPDSRIVLAWGSPEEGRENTVTMTFEPLEDGRTLLTIIETGWSEGESGIAGALGNTEGWAGMLMAMKGFVEYGLNLRQGFYK